MIRRTVLVLLVAILAAGCNATCESAHSVSPNGECDAFFVQDNLVDRNEPGQWPKTYAVVECKAWHVDPNVGSWNVVVLKNSSLGVKFRWIDDHKLEITTPTKVEIESSRLSIQNSLYKVDVVRQEARASEVSPAGCGLP